MREHIFSDELQYRLSLIPVWSKLKFRSGPPRDGTKLLRLSVRLNQDQLDRFRVDYSVRRDICTDIIKKVIRDELPKFDPDPDLHYFTLGFDWNAGTISLALWQRKIHDVQLNMMQ